MTEWTVQSFKPVAWLSRMGRDEFFADGEGSAKLFKRLRRIGADFRSDAHANIGNLEPELGVAGLFLCELEV